jgi:hypothetical protein
MEVWHGGHSYFSQFQEHAIGSGEGEAMGWGYYFAENRPGGEYFARYMYEKHKKGFLYRANILFTEDEILDLDSSFRQITPAMQCRVSRVFRSCEVKQGFHNAYKMLRDEIGNEAASKYLLGEGIMVLRSYEETKPGHGFTYVALDNSRIVIRDAFELEILPFETNWHPLPSKCNLMLWTTYRCLQRTRYLHQCLKY